MNNQIIRVAMIKTGVRAWQVANHIMNVSEQTFFKRMRNEMPENEQQRIAALIEEYAQNGGHGHE